MKMFQTVLTALLLVTSTAELSAQQAFGTRKEKGMVQVQFLPPSGGQSVQLIVDDRIAGTLPVTVYLVPGSHRFTFIAPGEPARTIVQVIKGDTVVPSVFNPTGFPLTINTNVPGAYMAIDGVAFPGNTTTVTPGPHTLTVSQGGYDTVTVPFNQPRNPNTLNVTLVGNAFPLVVNTNVPGAFLAVDGSAFSGNTTSVAAGPHTLSVSAPGYQPLTLPFNQPRGPNTVNVTLVGLQGTLSVNLDYLPRGGMYRVFINGSEVRGMGPQTLPAGSYQVRVTAGTFSMDTTATVNAGQNVTVTPSIQWSVQ